MNSSPTASVRSAPGLSNPFRVRLVNPKSVRSDPDPCRPYRVCPGSARSVRGTFGVSGLSNIRPAHPIRTESIEQQKPMIQHTA